MVKRTLDPWNLIDPKTGKLATSEAAKRRAHVADRAQVLDLLGWDHDSAYSTGELWGIARDRGLVQTPYWCTTHARGDDIRKCEATSGKANVYENGKRTYFFEINRIDHEGGTITGGVFKMLPGERCLKVGPFRIEPDGTFSRAPVSLRRLLLVS